MPCSDHQYVLLSKLLIKGCSIALLMIFQTTSSSAQLSADNIVTLQSGLSQYINDLRDSLGVGTLKPDPILRKAAIHHCKYMVQHDTLTHYQHYGQYRDARIRVLQNGGVIFQSVGENVLYTTPNKFPLTELQAKALAYRMYESWKNSPGHYANMIDPEFIFGDFGFRVHKSTGRVFSTHVLGKKGDKIEGQLSDKAFGLTKAKKSCQEGWSSYSNLVANMGNNILRNGNQYELHYHNRDHFNKIFDSKTDAIAIDVITRDQFTCGEPNRLHFSPIHDGILLEPTTKSTIQERNLAMSDYRIISKLSDLPPFLENKSIQNSTLLIRDGRLCQYLLPGYVPSKNYDLVPIEPTLLNPINTSFLNKGIIYSDAINYNFLTNRTNPTKLPRIPKRTQAIHSIDIHTYSSVEGDSLANAALHNSRGRSIKKHISNACKTTDDQYDISVSENWQKMNFQLHYYSEEELAYQSKDSIKRFIIDNEKYLPWDSLLFAQRQSRATINYSGSFQNINDSIKLAEVNLITAIKVNDFDLANKALYLLYHNLSSDGSYLMEDYIYDLVSPHPELVQNTAALFSKIYLNDLEQSTTYLFKWIFESEDLEDPVMANLFNLYTRVGSYLLKAWDVPSQHLANVIHPIKVNQLQPTEIDNSLLLNLHLTYIQYYGQINDGVNIGKSFQFISNFFKSESLTPVNDIALVHFYNYWSMYHLTKEHLRPKMDLVKTNEDLLFIYLQTATFHKEKTSQDQLLELHQLASNSNKSRWCTWVDESFQILRDHRVKRIFCKTCSEE